MINSYYSEDELKKMGFKELGSNVLISKKSSIYGAREICIGNNVRIDDFCILSGCIKIGNNIHIAAYSALFGGEKGIVINDYANISSRVCIYAISDDYSGETMTNPIIPEKYKKLQKEEVIIGEHVIIGSGSTVLPGVTLEVGTAVGAMSLCNKDTLAWSIYVGVPAKKIQERSKKLLDLVKEYEGESD